MNPQKIYFCLKKKKKRGKKEGKEKKWGKGKRKKETKGKMEEKKKEGKKKETWLIDDVDWFFDKQKSYKRRKFSAQIRQRRLTWVGGVCRSVKPPFHRARLIYISELESFVVNTWNTDFFKKNCLDSILRGAFFLMITCTAKNRGKKRKKKN